MEVQMNSRKQKVEGSTYWIIFFGLWSLTSIACGLKYFEGFPLEFLIPAWLLIGYKSDAIIRHLVDH
jgi:hypothetical protein